MLYFAYGSNMDPKQMGDRCPGARRVGPAVLEGFRLEFVWDSPGWGGGVGQIAPDGDAQVWGVLWEITPTDERSLDIYEGVADGVYVKEPFTVRLGDQARTAMAYRMPGSPRHKPPSARYVNALVRGAVDAGLPEDYITILRSNLPDRRDPSGG